MSEGFATYIIKVEEQDKSGRQGYRCWENEDRAGALSTPTKIRTIA
jgi:hypothetical protein